MISHNSSTGTDNSQYIAHHTNQIYIAILEKNEWVLNHVNNPDILPCPHNNLAISNSLNQSLQLTHTQIFLCLQIETEVNWRNPGRKSIFPV